MNTTPADERPTAPATERPGAGCDVAAETAVPDGADAAVCDRCGRPFPDADLLALHLGLAHLDDLGPDERRTFEAATREEAAALRVMRLQAVAALVVLYFGFLFAYSAVG